MKTTIKLKKCYAEQLKRWVTKWNERKHRKTRMIIGFEDSVTGRTCICTLYHDLRETEKIKRFLYWGWVLTNKHTIFKSEM